MQKLGDILMSLGLISRSQLEFALVQQKVVGMRLGEYLVEKEIISDQALATALSIQLGYEYVEILNAEVDTLLVKKGDVDFLLLKGILPMEVSGRRIYLATYDPLDEDSIMAVAQYYRKNPVVRVAAKKDLLTRLGAILSETPSVDESSPMAADHLSKLRRIFLRL